MLPLWVLTLFIYYTAVELFIWLNRHLLVRERLHRLDDDALHVHLSENGGGVSGLLLKGAENAGQVKRHFNLLRQVYLPPIDRRIRFLSVVITAGPLLGLLGTVTGMLSTFDGMVRAQGNKFEEIVEGISEALITTQTGLIIAIPAMVLLSLIIQHRHKVARALARLESYQTRQCSICVRSHA